MSAPHLFGVVALVLLTAAWVSVHTGAAPRAGVVATCAERAEGVRPVSPPDQRDLVIGPVAFRGLRAAGRAKPGSYTTVAGRRFGVWKAAPVVRTGRRVTVIVPQRLRGRVLLSVARHSAVRVVRFAPCTPAQPAFAYHGTVGPYTAWAGGMLAVHALCAELEVWVDGRAKPLRRSFAIGTGSCR